MSAPRISDLDRIAVVEETNRHSAVWNRMSASTRYIAMHSPFLVDVETFARHRWFAMPEPLELVMGTRLAVEEPQSLELLRLVAGIEGLVVSRLKLARQIAIGRVKVRPLLCDLHNVRHDLRLVGISNEEAPRAWALAEEVAAIRGSWWETADEDRDRRVSDLAASAARGIDEALARCPSTSADVPPVPSMSLCAQWGNVTLVIQSTTSHVRPMQRLLAGLSGRLSRRAGEMVWSRQRHELCVPHGVVSVLSSAAAGADELMATRLEVVRRYRAFMDRQTPGWSSIGLATIFAPE